jgi:AraC-like DNA-binding protein
MASEPIDFDLVNDDRKKYVVFLDLLGFSELVNRAGGDVLERHRVVEALKLVRDTGVQTCITHPRLWKEQSPSELRALPTADKQMAPALRLMHSDPGRSWSLDDLARECATSRTTFATRFRRIAGVPPLTHLSSWRMRLAERVLHDTDRAVSDIADSLGFSSESSFSHSFKRSSGVGPKAYRQRSRLTQAGV